LSKISRKLVGKGPAKRVEAEEGERGRIVVKRVYDKVKNKIYLVLSGRAVGIERTEAQGDARRRFE